MIPGGGLPVVVERDDLALELLREEFRGASDPVRSLRSPKNPRSLIRVSN